MKTARSTTNAQNKQGNSHVPKPEIRDNLDSRDKQEQQSKGTIRPTIKRHIKTTKP